MQTMAPAALTAALTLSLGGAIISPAAATQELIQNGDFETGTFSPWTVTSQGDSAFYVRPDGSQNNTFQSTVGPASGSYYAVSDQVSGSNGGNGDAALIQSFTVSAPASSVVLSYDMFVDNYADPFAYSPTPAGTDLDYNTPNNQQARVDLLTQSASAFSVASSDVLENFYQGSDPVTDPSTDNPHPYTHYSYDITSLVGGGGTFQLRFAEVNNEDNLYQGVDNVSILDTPAAPPAPEPSQAGVLALMALGLGGLCWRARRRAVG